MATLVQDPPAHPAARMFPLLEGDDFERLCADIREHGQLEPCTMHDGVLLDGRNRFRACRHIGREPLVVDWSGECGSPAAFVVSKNINRRHLNPSQRALLAKELEPIFADEAKLRQQEAGREFGRGTEPEKLPQKVGGAIDPHSGEAAEQAAKSVGANREYVRLAKRLQSKAPDLYAAVEAGSMSLSTAEKKEQSRRGKPAPPRRDRVRADQMHPPQPTPEQLVRYGFEGLAQHAHDFHSVVLRTQNQILLATKTWRPDARLRLLNELRDIALYLPGWIDALAGRDEEGG